MSGTKQSRLHGKEMSLFRGIYLFPENVPSQESYQAQCLFCVKKVKCHSSNIVNQIKHLQNTHPDQFTLYQSRAALTNSDEAGQTLNNIVIKVEEIYREQETGSLPITVETLNEEMDPEKRPVLSEELLNKYFAKVSGSSKLKCLQCQTLVKKRGVLKNLLNHLIRHVDKDPEISKDLKLHSDNRASNRMPLSPSSTTTPADSNTLKSNPGSRDVNLFLSDSLSSSNSSAINRSRSLKKSLPTMSVRSSFKPLEKFYRIPDHLKNHSKASCMKCGLQLFCNRLHIMYLAQHYKVHHQEEADEVQRVCESIEFSMPMRKLSSPAQKDSPVSSEKPQRSTTPNSKFDDIDYPASKYRRNKAYRLISSYFTVPDKLQFTWTNLRCCMCTTKVYCSLKKTAGLLEHYKSSHQNRYGQFKIVFKKFDAELKKPTGYQAKNLVQSKRSAALKLNRTKHLSKASTGEPSSHMVRTKLGMFDMAKLYIIPKGLAKARCKTCGKMFSQLCNGIGLYNHARTRHPDVLAGITPSTVSKAKEKKSAAPVAREEHAIVESSALHDTGDEDVHYDDSTAVGADIVIAEEEGQEMEGQEEEGHEMMGIVIADTESLQEESRQVFVINLLAEFLLPMSVLDSDNFIGLVNSLNPSYQLPAGEFSEQELIPARLEIVIDRVKKLMEKSRAICICLDSWQRSGGKIASGDTAVRVTTVSATFLVNWELHYVHLISHVDRNDGSLSNHDVIYKAMVKFALRDKVLACITHNVNESRGVGTSITSVQSDLENGWHVVDAERFGELCNPTPARLNKPKKKEDVSSRKNVHVGPVNTEADQADGVAPVRDVATARPSLHELVNQSPNAPNAPNDLFFNMLGTPEPFSSPSGSSARPIINGALTNGLADALPTYNGVSDMRKITELDVKRLDEKPDIVKMKDDFLPSMSPLPASESLSEKKPKTPLLVIRSFTKLMQIMIQDAILNTPKEVVAVIEMGLTEAAKEFDFIKDHTVNDGLPGWVIQTKQLQKHLLANKEKIPVAAYSVLSDVVRYLEPFAEARQILADDLLSGSLVLPTLTRLQLLLPKLPGSTEAREFLTALTAQLDKYKKIYEDNEAYLLASILHPRFKVHWASGNKRTEYKNMLLHSLELTSTAVGDISPNADPAAADWFGDLLSETEPLESVPLLHEVDEYLSEPPLKGGGKQVLAYWKAKETTWPGLSSLANKYLTLTAGTSRQTNFMYFLPTCGLVSPCISGLTDETFEGLLQIRCNTKIVQLDN